MRYLIRNLSLKKKIQSIVFLCIFLMTATALVSNHFIAAAYDGLLYRTIASSLSVSSLKMQNSLENLNTMADLMLGDAGLQRELSVMKDSDRVQDINVAYRSVYTSLMEYYFTFRKNHIKYMALHQDELAIRTHLPSALERFPKEVEEDLKERALKAEGAVVWVTDYSPDYGLFLVRLIRRTEYLRLDSIGILIVNVDPGMMAAEAADSGPFQRDSAYLLFDRENFIYASASLPAQLTAGHPDLLDDSYGTRNFSGKDFFYVKSSIPDFNWSYACVVPFDTIRSSLDASRNLCVFILLVSVVLSAVLSSRLIRSITRHFENLLQKIRNFGEGNQTPLPVDYDYSGRSDELGILHMQFDYMVEEVNQLIRTNYLNEILIKDAQFKALESQMNPHFLYNTLESINWRAKLMGAKDISSMAESLGTLLRITLDQKSKQVPLSRELELVRCYMTIQKYRYEERLDYEIQVEKELFGCYVLKLTLQPLVENAVRYGLEENTEECLIRITAEADREKGILYIYIKNNGSSFPEGLLEKLETHQVQPHGFGIGLLNIRDRMLLTFGENYGLDLYNEDELAVARLTCPLTDISKGGVPC
ncbi:MAG: sensor histidine kinase [Hungatella sp.]|nr:sensor histidine kinase [Hungatella sp.]